MSVHPGYYDSLNTCYNEMVESLNKVILMDLKRTGGAKMLDYEREAMRRVLSNYAKHNFDIGYCQGFNFICHFLFQAGFEEEEVFWAMCKVMDHLMPPHYYIQMIPAVADIEFFTVLFRAKEPKFAAQLEARNIDLNFVLIPSFITLFTNFDNLEVRSSAQAGHLRLHPHGGVRRLLQGGPGPAVPLPKGP